MIKKVSSSLSQFSSGTEKAAIQTDLLGKSGLKFGLALEEMARSSSVAEREARNLGATLSGVQLAELSAMDDRVDDLGTAWSRFAQQLSSFVAPAVDFAAKALTNLLAMASDGLKAMNSLAGISGATDTRSKPPALVDQSKVLERARASADGQMKIMDAQLKQEMAYKQARTELAMQSFHARESIELTGQFAIAKEQESIRQASASKVAVSMEKELQSFDAYFAKKRAMYGSDEKGIADELKFEQESIAKRGELLNQIDQHELKSQGEKHAGMMRLYDLGQQITIQTYQDAVSAAKALDDNQRALFQSESAMLGASEAARRVRFNLIEEEAALSRAMIDQTIADETRKAQALQNLELETDTKRRQAIQQSPSFFESQMQAIVASNAFSMGSMVSTWSSGIGQMVVHGGNLQAVWEQTQVAIVQAALHGGVQMVAQMALSLLQKEALITTSQAAQVAGQTAMESAKTAATTAGEVARLAIVTATSKAISASTLGQLTAVGALASGMIALMGAVIGAVVAMMGAIASALAAGVVTASLAVPVTAAAIGLAIAGGASVTAGQAAILAATAAAGSVIGASLAVPGFARGGIGSFGAGTQATLHGQEAIIPLNSRGAAFMQDAMGGGGGGNMTIVLQEDGRERARTTMKYMPGIVYMKTGMA